MADKHHRVRTHHWESGELKYYDTLIFGEFEEAMAFAITVECDNFKIYDQEEALLHASAGKTRELYA